MENKPKLSSVAKMIPEATNLQEIGSGAFKVVYRARVSGNDEAVKIVKIPNDTDDIKDENLGRIRREIETIRKHYHPIATRIWA